MFELNIIDADIIIAALLHDIYRVDKDISHEIIDYNFGAYIGLLIGEIPSEFDVYECKIEPVSYIDIEYSFGPETDYLIITLSQCLDNLRSPDISSIFNPIKYILSLDKLFIKPLENKNNKYIKYLIDEIKKISSSFIG